MKKFNILDSFTLKIIAMVTMAIDHLGIILLMFWGGQNVGVAYTICRYIGRLAMPLYAFMIVEGVLHTHNYKKYALRLGILAALISTTLALAYYIPELGLSGIASVGNIFLDLLLGSAMIYTLNHKKLWVKFLALIPLAIGILSFIAKGIEYSSSCTTCGGKILVLWFPMFLRLQYDWLSLALMIGYFLAYFASKLFYKIREENTGLSASNMEGTNEQRISINLFALVFTILISAFYYLFKYFDNTIVFWDANCQLFMMVGGLIILFYSGARGYNKKWFNIFSYAYYPVHIILIYGICYLLSLI